MGKFTTSDGVNLYYEVNGEGKPIVLIHGWSADSTSFKPHVKELSKDFKVVTYDLRGHGRSDRPDKGLTLNRFAIDLEELMEYLELNDVTVVGWSMGSSILFDYVRTFGVSRLSSVCIVDMTPKLINDDEWKLGLYHGEFTMQDTLNALTTMCYNWMDFAVPFIKRTIPYLSEEQLKPVYEATSKNSPHVMSAMWLAMSVNDYRDVLESITVPAFIIYGEKSTLYSSKTAEYLNSKIPNSKVIPFENCTHFLVVENPKKLVEVIREAASI
jgi:non-heme chloroperoxidase